MKAEFKESFARDLKKVKDKSLLQRVKATIEQVEQATTPQEIDHLKHLAGSGHYYRIRIGDYRLGLRLDGETIVFVRCLHRREVYRYFP